MFAAQLSHRHTAFGLAQDRKDPGVAISGHLHSKSPRSSCRENSPSQPLAFGGDYHPQDLFAAARADYARILNALYARGHYSAVITIRIDGREAANTRLRRTGIFSSVTLTEDDRISAPDLPGITATIVEQKPRRYSVGAEIASLDGLALTGSWLHRNLLGGGERLKLEADIPNIGAGTSGTDYSFGVTLERPATLTPDTTAGLTFKIARLDEVDYSADTAEFGLTFNQFFFRDSDGPCRSHLRVSAGSRSRRII